MVHEQEGGTFAEAIAAGRDVFEAARLSLGKLPAASEPCKATTVEGALKEQEERLHSVGPGLKQPKSKQRSGGAPSETTHPGYKIGVAGYTSPFWALVEVRARAAPPAPRRRFVPVCARRHARDDCKGVASEQTRPSPLLPRRQRAPGCGKRRPYRSLAAGRAPPGHIAPPGPCETPRPSPAPCAARPPPLSPRPLHAHSPRTTSAT